MWILPVSEEPLTKLVRFRLGLAAPMLINTRDSTRGIQHFGGQTDPKLTAERDPKRKRTTKSAHPELESRLGVGLIQLDGLRRGLVSRDLGTTKCDGGDL